MSSHLKRIRQRGRRRPWRAAVGCALAAAACLATAGPATAQERSRVPPAAAPAFSVDGRLALHALSALGDSHLQQLADVLHVLAGTSAARSGEWERIRAPLAEVGRRNVPAVLWFARRDGSYWTVTQGRAGASLADRPYFPRLLAGQTVLGDLVVSRSTQGNTAIVAVPVRGAGGRVTGALGASVHLDSLAARLRQEMGGLDRGLIFYAIDSAALGALNSDPALIFSEPMKLGDEGMRRAFTEMRAHEQGVVTYDFRGSRRTVLYRHSPVTGWWYGFGMLAPGSAAAAAPAAGGRPDREVPLGGLFSVSGGGWSTLGRTAKAAMELAVEDVNRYLEGNAAGIRFVAVVEDTRLDPAIALEKARALRARGVQLLIGPQSSAEVARLKPYVDANGLLLVSPSSTAGTLTLAGDNVFRFTPADSLEAAAVSALMWEDGVRAVVPVWRDDPGNISLVRATRARLTALGGTVLAGTAFAPDARTHSGTAATLRAQLQQAVARHGARAVAVYLTGFDDVLPLLASAAADSVLASVRWYGSDGVVHSTALVADATAAAFAERVGYPSPIFGVEEGARDIWQPLAARIRAGTGLEPDAFAFAVYDAVWVVARGYVASGATVDVEQLKRAFMTAAATHYGATGWTALDAAGDRRYGDFDFWAVRRVDGAPRWVRVAHYETRTGRLVRPDAAPRAASP